MGKWGLGDQSTRKPVGLGRDGGSVSGEMGQKHVGGQGGLTRETKNVERARPFLVLCLFCFWFASKDSRECLVTEANGKPERAWAQETQKALGEIRVEKVGAPAGPAIV